jgi:hypothetical protein
MPYNFIKIHTIEVSLMPFTSKQKADYIELINELLDKIRVTKSPDFDDAIVDLEKILQPNADPINFHADLKFGMDFILDSLQNPDMYVQSPSNYEEFREIVKYRIQAKIKEFTEFTSEQKDRYIENQRRLREQAAAHQEIMAAGESSREEHARHMETEVQMLQGIEREFQLGTVGNRFSETATGFFRSEAADLSTDQRRALQELRQTGLTADHLHRWQGIVFQEPHKDALIYLMRTRHLSPDAAIAEINGLNHSQARGIAAGFSRQDVAGLENGDLMSALLALRGDGLTPDHLRCWQGIVFQRPHIDTLIYLIRTRQLSPEAAIAEINGLDHNQATGIASGFSRQDVAGLNCPYLMRALLELRGDGLTPDHLRRCQGIAFQEDHIKALIYLIRTKHLSPEAAIAEINGLNNYIGARCIATGFSRNDIAGLENGLTYRLEALLELHQDGLTPDHLRSWSGRLFQQPHKDALIYLIRTKHLSPEAAIAEINNIDTDQARRITAELPRNEIIGRSREYQHRHIGLLRREFTGREDQVRNILGQARPERSTTPVLDIDQRARGSTIGGRIEFLFDMVMAPIVNDGTTYQI